MFDISEVEFKTQNAFRAVLKKMDGNFYLLKNIQLFLKGRIIEYRNHCWVKKSKRLSSLNDGLIAFKGTLTKYKNKGKVKYSIKHIRNSSNLNLD